MLNWDEAELIKYLEVFPEYFESDYHGDYCIFKVIKNSIELELIIFPFESDVKFELKNIETGNVLFEYQIMGCQSIKRHRLNENQESISFLNNNGAHLFLSIDTDILIKIVE